MIRELFAHQEWADSAILGAVRAHTDAADDEDLRKLLHHILLVQRVFHALITDRPFALEKESQPPATFDELETLFRATHAEQMALVEGLQESELERMVEFARMPGLKLSVRHTLMQVVMHSHSHRAQCATRLRMLGGKAPVTDFILWVRDRPAPVWPAA
jgi:uncharacterized damage-inducible protein DinB